MYILGLCEVIVLLCDGSQYYLYKKRCPKAPFHLIDANHTGIIIYQSFITHDVRAIMSYWSFLAPVIFDLFNNRGLIFKKGLGSFFF